MDLNVFLMNLEKSDAMGRTEDAYYTVHTGADFYCGDAKVRSK